MTPTSKPVPAQRAGGRPLPSPTTDLVLRLQGERHDPSVSLLLDTEPAERMSNRDRERLRAQHREAVRRLAAEPVSRPAAAAILERLDRQVDRASSAPTGAALAVYAGPTSAMALTLTVSVQDRVVVDPSFATRDLVRCLHRTPRHAVLVLDWDEARLYSGHGESLTEVRRRFPLSRAAYGADTDRFLHTVDRAFGAHLAVHPSPVVVAGRPSLLTPFVGQSTHLQRLAGVLPLDPAITSTVELVQAVAPRLEAYLLSRQREAFDLVARSRLRGVLASGMREAWRAAWVGRPEMLAVEQGLFYPARVVGNGHRLEPTTDIEDPEVIDDAVDELIELVLLRGGWVAFVDDGQLAEHDGAALVLRPPDPVEPLTAPKTGRQPRTPVL